MSKAIRKKPLKPCNEIGCNELTRDAYCDAHKKASRKRYRIYNKNVRDKTIDNFYRSKEWRKLRLVALERDNHLCIWCKDNGKLKQADVVHHIIEVEDDWDKRLTLDNLVSLCHRCHNRHHKSNPLG